MIFKLHFWLITAGASASNILLGVYMKEYTDASPADIGFIFMIMPFISIITRPMICSMADRNQAHYKYFMICLLANSIIYLPYIVMPLIGPKFYGVHPRLCWYILASLRILSDVVTGGIISIGDALVINYARMVGTNYSTYRIWATFSWMFFGLVFGQVNEISFLPRYVPAFMILVACNLLDLFIIWLWPREYFIIVSEEEQEKLVNEKGSVTSKCLLPMSIVWARAKGKLVRLLYRKTESFEVSQNGEQIPALATKFTTIIDSRNEKFEQDEPNAKMPNENESIGWMTQLLVLKSLFKRDLRIIMYLLFFMSSGTVISSLIFLFIDLSEVCHNKNTCDFSFLGGLLQIAMAVGEGILFIFINRIKVNIGRVNTCALFFLLYGLKMGFYALLWTQVSPYYAILAEALHGAAFGINLTLMVEMGYLFSSEVPQVIPELIKRGEISVESKDKMERLKLSVAATMQSIIDCTNDGLGRGLGSLVFGQVLQNYSYKNLWRGIAIVSWAIFLVIILINIVDFFCGKRLRLNRLEPLGETPKGDVEV